MSGVFPFIDAAHRAGIRFVSDLPNAVHAALLTIAALIVGTKIVFAWLRGAMSGVEATVLLVAVLVSEAVAVTWVRDFHGLTFALLLALPFAVWASAETLVRTNRHESYRSEVRDEIRRYELALARDPQNAAARELLGDAQMKLGHPRLAVEQYRAARNLSGASPETRYKLQRAERRLRGTT